MTRALVVAALACRPAHREAVSARVTGQTIEVAVIGGMIETGLWQALATRYEAARGNRRRARPLLPGRRAVAATG